MKDGLYHKDIGFPIPASSFKFGTVGLKYSRHAIEASFNDRYGWINLPDLLNTNTAVLIELEIRAGRIVKLVYRTKYNNQYDLILAIALGGLVKTVWLNSNEDSHNTLNLNRYQKLSKVS